MPSPRALYVATLRASRRRKSLCIECGQKAVRDRARCAEHLESWNKYRRDADRENRRLAALARQAGLSDLSEAA